MLCRLSQQVGLFYGVFFVGLQCLFLVGLVACFWCSKSAVMLGRSFSMNSQFGPKKRPKNHQYWPKKNFWYFHVDHRINGSMTLKVILRFFNTITDENKFGLSVKEWLTNFCFGTTLFFSFFIVKLEIIYKRYFWEKGGGNQIWDILDSNETYRRQSLDCGFNRALIQHYYQY